MSADDHPVQIERAAALAALAMGALAMIVTGLQPLLLSELADAGRLSPTLVHPAAILDMLCLAASVAACALFLTPRDLPRRGAVAALLCVAAGLGALVARDGQVLALRAVGGLAGGVLIWVTVGMIARQARPEPWAAAFFLSQSVGQVLAAGLVASLLSPRFGPAGGVALAAGLSALAGLCALAGPVALPDLDRGPGGRLPGRRGLIALGALLLYFAGNAALWFQMRPLAAARGLEEITGTIVLVTLVAQMLGAMAALALAERLSRRRLFALVVALALTAIGLLATGPPAPLFIAGFGLAAFAALLLGASLFGVLNAADPTRRAGAVSPSAQFCAAALGPLIGAGAASAAGPSAALAVAAALALASLACAGLSLGPDRGARVHH